MRKVKVVVEGTAQIYAKGTLRIYEEGNLISEIPFGNEDPIPYDLKASDIEDLDKAQGVKITLPVTIQLDDVADILEDARDSDPT